MALDCLVLNLYVTVASLSCFRMHWRYWCMYCKSAWYC